MRVLGLGDNTIDTYVDRAEQFPGGNAVNVAVLCRRLGAEAGYLGCIGDDEAGDLLKHALADEGIEISHCRFPVGANARAFIAHHNGDRRFLRSFAGVRGQWGAFSSADLAYISGFDLVHSSVYSELESHRNALSQAIQRWSFDFSERWTPAVLEQWLGSLDAAFLSHPQGSDEECADLARWCAARGTRSVVITRGLRGAYALRGGAVATSLPVPTTVVDTLGAGDGFIAGYLMADMAGAGLDEALSAGARFAAEACGRFGAFGHGRPWFEEKIAITS